MRKTFLLLSAPHSLVADQLKYQKPSKEILDILNAPAPPVLAVNPTRTYASLSQMVRYPSIAEVSEPMLRIAGMRIDPRTNGLHLAPHSSIGQAHQAAGGHPARSCCPRLAHWSANCAGPTTATHFAFTNTTPHGIELWIGDPSTERRTRYPGIAVNAVLGEPIDWMPDNRTLLVKAVPSRRGPAPEEPKVPLGPHVQESAGHAMGVATYEDLLQNPHDEDLYEYYATSQLVSIDTSTGKVTPLGKSGILEDVDISPDGKDLLVTREHRPFSYLHPAREFPKEVEIWDVTGRMVHTVASVPLPERVPLGGVQPGPRQFRWIPTETAAVMWVEALDGGNPKEKVPHRDRVVASESSVQRVSRSKYSRPKSATRACSSARTSRLIEDTARISRIVRTFKIDPTKPDREAKLIWSRNAQDRYKDPGRPVTSKGTVNAAAFPGAAVAGTLGRARRRTSGIGQFHFSEWSRRLVERRPSVPGSVRSHNRQIGTHFPMPG